MPAERDTPARPMRVLIVDDEALGRVRLEDLLRHEPGVEIVGSVGDGDAAIAAIRTLHPDLVFLDVQMPGKTGLDVVRQVGAAAMPATIFVTAYDRFAVQAFEVAALDYLVKPFDDERFDQAFARAQRMLALEGMDQLRDRLLAVLHGNASVEPPGAPTPYLERIAVELHGQVRPISVGEIDYITASGPYAELHVGGKRYVIREAMQVLEERLDPSQFMRVHRSAIVRLSLVETLHRAAGGDYQVQLKDGTRLKVSRSRREALERWLGLPS